jgi:hypothetical protein
VHFTTDQPVQLFDAATGVPRSAGVCDQPVTRLVHGLGN